MLYLLSLLLSVGEFGWVNGTFLKNTFDPTFFDTISISPFSSSDY